MKFATSTPQKLLENMPKTPAPAEFVEMGRALIGPQPSLMDLIDRCAKSMQDQAKSEKTRK